MARGPEAEGIDPDQAARLAAALSALVERFKMGPDGAAYEGLPLTEAAIVARVAEAEAEGRAVIQREVGDALGLPKTTVTSAVGRLAARGLIERAAGADARARELRLTEAGRALALALRRARLGASAAMLAALPPRERARLVALLEAVAAGTGRGPGA